MGFRGITISDDLEMKAITAHHSMEETVHLGFEAGLDCFLICHSIDKQVEALETLLKIAEDPKVPRGLWDIPMQRILGVKQRRCRFTRQIDRAHAGELIGAREHLRISRRLRDELVKSRNRAAEAAAREKLEAENAKAQKKEQSKS